MQHLGSLHVDEEGCFHSEQFKEYCGLKTVEIKMAAGEAHWQNGIVERHIGTFRELLNKLFLEDAFEGATNQSIVDSVTEAKPQRDIQWHFTKSMDARQIPSSANRHGRSIADAHQGISL